MQIRKLVKSGESSHTISLPKEWISNNSLKKGDLLYINEENNKLIISAEGNKDENKKEKEIVLNVDNQDTNTLRRKTISAYINNYHLFSFIGDSLNQRLEDIRKILQNFLALEIVEQADTKIVAKDFLNIKEFSLPTTIRRMDMLTRSIISDAKKGKKESQPLQFKDYEVDKLFFLVSRLIRSHLSANSTDMSNVHAHYTWWIAKNLESISDSAKNISAIFSKDIESIYSEVENYYLECAKAYFKKDKEIADKMMEKRIDLLNKCDNVKDSESRHLLKNMVNSSRNLAKITLDSEN